MGSSPGFGSLGRDYSPFRTRFPSGSACPWLNLATPNHSSAHSTKGTPSPQIQRPAAPTGRKRTVSGALSLPLNGVLFTIPSRYWFPIGRLWYLALGGGPPRFPPAPTWPAVLTSAQHAPTPRVAYGALTRSGGPFQQPSAAGRKDLRASTLPRTPWTASNPDSAAPAGSSHRLGLGSSPFARRYSGNPFFSSGY
jgi:hypothetical protein